MQRAKLSLALLHDVKERSSCLCCWSSDAESQGSGRPFAAGLSVAAESLLPRDLVSVEDK